MWGIGCLDLMCHNISKLFIIFNMPTPTGVSDVLMFSSPYRGERPTHTEVSVLFITSPHWGEKTDPHRGIGRYVGSVTTLRWKTDPHRGIGIYVGSVTTQRWKQTHTEVSVASPHRGEKPTHTEVSVASPHRGETDPHRGVGCVTTQRWNRPTQRCRYIYGVAYIIKSIWLEYCDTFGYF